MSNLDRVRDFVGRDHGLVVVFTSRADGTGQASVVNAGVLPHPTSGDAVVGLVAAGGSRKLVNLRERPYATVVFRAGWEYIAVEGATVLCGPDDELDGVDAEGVRILLRDVFVAAGGTHDDFDEYDRVMAAERRTAVLITPERIYPG